MIALMRKFMESTAYSNKEPILYAESTIKSLVHGLPQNDRAGEGHT